MNQHPPYLPARIKSILSKRSPPAPLAPVFPRRPFLPLLLCDQKEVEYGHQAKQCQCHGNGRFKPRFRFRQDSLSELPEIAAISRQRRQIQENPKHHQGDPKPQRDPMPRMPFNVLYCFQLPQKQAEARDDKAESHQCQAGANPGQKRAFRGQRHTRVFVNQRSFLLHHHYTLCVTIQLDPLSHKPLFFPRVANAIESTLYCPRARRIFTNYPRIMAMNLFILQYRATPTITVTMPIGIQTTRLPKTRLDERNA